MSDVLGVPGDIMESWNVTTLPSCAGPCPLTTLTPVSDQTLIAGAQYWVVATGGPQTFDIWTLTLGTASFAPLLTQSVPVGFPITSGWAPSGGERQGALVVSGNVVPEPATAALLVSSFSLLVLLRGVRHRRGGEQSITLGSPTSSGLPERRGMKAFLLIFELLGIYTPPGSGVDTRSTPRRVDPIRQ